MLHTKNLFKPKQQYFRLKKPQLCPDNIYADLVMTCWRDNPKDRPNFTQIIIQLDNFLAEYGECIGE